MAHSEESEDYWPGYVDALTSMVQVLAFVMMLLAMAVFVLSQSVAKGAVEAIAKAANIDVRADAGVAELTAKVLDTLQKAAQQTTPQTQQTSAPNAPEAPPKAVATTQAASAEKPAETAPVTAQPARTPTERIANSALRQKNAEPEVEGRRMSVVFAPASFVVPTPSQTAISTFVHDTLAHPEPRVLVRAFASPSNGSISEARRLAYYRAVSVRKDLLAQNIPAGAIQIRIFDTPDAGQGETAEIVALETAPAK